MTVSKCDGPFGSGLKSEHYTEGKGIRVIRLQNIRFAEFDDRDIAFIEPEHYKELGDHDVFAGDVLIAGLGDENNPVGRACVAPSALGPTMVKADCFRFRLDRRKVEAAYVALQLSAVAYTLAGALATGTTRGRMNLSTTATRAVAIPPLGEQISIVSFLSHETAEIDTLVAKIETAIERLQEYHAALVTAAVTGKIDVRGNVGVLDLSELVKTAAGEGRGSTASAEAVVIRDAEEALEGANAAPLSGHVVLLLYLNNKTFLDVGGAVARLVQAAMDRRIAISMVHEQEPSCGGVPFRNFFQQTPQVLQQPPYNLYNTVAVPLFPSEEHSKVSLRLGLRSMGAVPCDAGPLQRRWQLLRRHMAVARLVRRRPDQPHQELSVQP